MKRRLRIKKKGVKRKSLEMSNEKGNNLSIEDYRKKN